MRKYDHLFFDLDNTLWDFDSNSRLALEQTLQKLGINGHVSFDSFFEYYHQINLKLWESYRKNEVSKAELVQTRFEKPLNHFNIRGIEPLKMNELYLQQMALQTKLIDGAIPTLEYLKSKGYQMHIITNGFKEVQNRKLQTSGLSHYIERVFTSEEVRYPKPDKRIFQHALKSCNAKKTKSLMIGDSWEIDIIGAANAGIKQVFFKNNNKNTSPPPISSTHSSYKIHFHNTRPLSNTFFICKLSELNKML